MIGITFYPLLPRVRQSGRLPQDIASSFLRYERKERQGEQLL